MEALRNSLKKARRGPRCAAEGRRSQAPEACLRRSAIRRAFRPSTGGRWGEDSALAAHLPLQDHKGHRMRQVIEAIGRMSAGRGLACFSAACEVLQVSCRLPQFGYAENEPGAGVNVVSDTCACAAVFWTAQAIESLSLKRVLRSFLRVTELRLCATGNLVDLAFASCDALPTALPATSCTLPAASLTPPFDLIFVNAHELSPV